MTTRLVSPHLRTSSTNHPDPLTAPTRPVEPTLAPTRPSRPAPFAVIQCSGGKLATLTTHSLSPSRPPNNTLNTQSRAEPVAVPASSPTPRGSPSLMLECVSTRSSSCPGRQRRGGAVERRVRDQLRAEDGVIPVSPKYTPSRLPQANITRPLACHRLTCHRLTCIECEMFITDALRTGVGG